MDKQQSSREESEFFNLEKSELLLFEPESIETTLWHIFSEIFLAQSVGIVLKSTYWKFEVDEKTKSGKK